MWQPPSLSLVWPPFFRSDRTEEQQVIATAALALQSNMITRRMALEKIRSVYPFENMEAVLEQIEEQAEEAAEHSVEKLLSKAMKSEEKDEADEDGAAERSGEEEDEEAPASR